MDTRRPAEKIVCSILMILLLASPHFAWDAVGHKTVTRITWETMKPQTRTRVMALLNQAPRDSDIHTLRNESLPPEIRNREFFVNVSVWADIMRDETHPERRDKYHRSTWHYINYFWEQTDTGVKERTDLQPLPENAVERLQFIRWRLGDEARSDADRAIDIAWVLHLVGDIHQPLHCSARVTATEPQGDQGGNLVLLDKRPAVMPQPPQPPLRLLNLHAYWDGIVDRAITRNAEEAEVDYVSRVTKMITGKYPATAAYDQLKAGQFSMWAQEGYATAKTIVYPTTLKREERPSAEYLNSAWTVSERAMAWAGYRMAAVLDEMFGN
jgi:hypothetical protein